MSLPTDATPRARNAIALLACATLICGCTSSPTTGRAQFNILPGSLETTVPDLRFDVKTMLASASEFCKEDSAAPEAPCPAREQAEQLSRRIAPIAERLGAVIPELSPEMVTRVPHVEVFIVPNDSVSVTSSAGGKIAVGSGIARLSLSDTDLALALAREFGRLASAHHRESTSAGIAVSLVTSSPLVGAYVATSFLADLLFPMGALFKVGISLIGSMGTEQLVELSQQGEADEFAGKLLMAAGYDLHELAGPRQEAADNAVKLGRLPAYFTSRAKVAGMMPHSVAMAKLDSDQAPPPANVEGAAPTAEAARQTANPESPNEAKPEAKLAIKVMMKREAQPQAREDAKGEPAPPSSTVPDRQPAVESRDDMDVPTADVSAPSVAAPPPTEARIAEALPAAESPALADVRKEPVPEARPEPNQPRLQPANAPKLQAKASKGKPVAKKMVSKPAAAVPKSKPSAKPKPPVKKRKNVRKPPPGQP